MKILRLNLFMMALLVAGSVSALDLMMPEAACPVDMADRETCLTETAAQNARLTEMWNAENQAAFPDNIQLVESLTGGLTAKPVPLSAVPTTPVVLQLQNSNPALTPAGSTPPDINGQNSETKQKGFFARLVDKLFGWLRR